MGTRASRRWLQWLAAGALCAGLVVVCTRISSTSQISAVPAIERVGMLTASIVTLLAVFWGRVAIWKMVLEAGGGAGWQVAIQSRLRPLLAKYAPGKVWGLITAVACLERNGMSRSDAIAVTGWFQIAQVVSGLAVGASGVAMLGVGFAGIAVSSGTLVWVSLVICAGLIAAGPVVNYAARRKGRVQWRRWMGPSRAGFVLVCMAGAWVAMGVAYWQFFEALGLDLDPVFIAILPIANVAGMLAIITPGGIGVRESLIAAMMVACGGVASTASVAALWSRVWFLGGEILAFVGGVVAGGTLQKRKERKDE